MIAVVQRVSRAQVRVAGIEPQGIGPGLLVLLGVGRDDGEADAAWLAKKCLSLRVFNDAAGLMNCGLDEIGGEILAVSQFTLLGDCVKGRRPSWSQAAEPAVAQRLYERFVAHLREGPYRVATGVFQATMEVELVNDGPVTLILDSRQWPGRPGGGAGAPADAHAAGAAVSGAGMVCDPPAPAGAAEAGRRLLRHGHEPFFLASRSPRRRHLLQMLGAKYTAREPDEEGGGPAAGETPAEYAMRQAGVKANSVAERVGAGIVLGADTIVCLEGAVLEKPRDPIEAAAYLRRLSGRAHEVYTGICLRRVPGMTQASAVERSRVTFAELDDATIADYVATGEPLDKAGAYGIQGYGALLVAAIEGCYFNVMGLPLARLRALFREFEGLGADGRSADA
jgi:D-tyrosyl-tRNA(Tyr) deacylase/MAF protein